MKKLLLFAILFLPSLVSAQAIKQGTTSSAGDAGSNIPLCVASAASGTLNTEGKYGYCSVDLSGNLRTTASFSFSGGTSDATKLEDAAHSSGDRGEFVMGVRSNSYTNLTDTNGDYSPLTLDANNRLWVTGTYNEDQAHGSGDEGFPVFLLRSDTLASTAANGDYENPKGDSAGRTYTNPWGANHTEWKRAQATSDVTDTTSTALLTATSSKYHYVTNVNCTNTGATATRVDIIDQSTGTPTMWSGYLPAGGGDGQNFSPPLKTVDQGAAINFKPATAGSATRCFINAFDSAN